jgi:hypothetical protein
MPRSLGIALVCLAFSCPAAFAFKPAPPIQHDVRSANGRFVLDVNPKVDRLTVSQAENRSASLWSFNFNIWQEKQFLSNDGSVVTIVSWRFVQKKELADGPCVQFFNRTGRFREYTFAEICPNPSRVRDEGPVGDFWREWYTHATSDGDRLTILTTGGEEFIFSLKDGSIVEKHRLGMTEAEAALWTIAIFAGVGLLLFIAWLCAARLRKANY